MDEQAIGGDGDRAKEPFEPEDEAWANDVAELDRRFRELVRENPFLVMTVAVATGFVLGRLLSRR